MAAQGWRETTLGHHAAGVVRNAEGVGEFQPSGWSAATTLGNRTEFRVTLKGLDPAERFQRLISSFHVYPGLKQPWAEIANAFGVPRL